MKLQIISAYVSHTGEVVAIAQNSYFILKKQLDEYKAKEIVDKINSIRLIETEYWDERR